MRVEFAYIRILFIDNHRGMLILVHHDLSTCVCSRVEPNRKRAFETFPKDHHDLCRVWPCLTFQKVMTCEVAKRRHLRSTSFSSRWGSGSQFLFHVHCNFSLAIPKSYTHIPYTKVMNIITGVFVENASVLFKPDDREAGYGFVWCRIRIERQNVLSQDRWPSWHDLFSLVRRYQSTWGKFKMILNRQWQG